MAYAYPHDPAGARPRATLSRRRLAHRDHRRHDAARHGAGCAQRAHDAHREALTRSRHRLGAHLRADAAVQPLLRAALRLHPVLRAAHRHDHDRPIPVRAPAHLRPGHHGQRVPHAQGDAQAGQLRSDDREAEARLAALPAREDVRLHPSLQMSEALPMRSRRPLVRRAFTLVEILTSLVILGIIGVAFVRLITSQARFTEGQMAMRNARTVSRNAMNIMLTDLRMVQDSGGLVSAASDSVVVRVPVAFGLLCANAAGVATMQLLPVDSAMTAMGQYSGWAYRDSTSGLFFYNDA